MSEVPGYMKRTEIAGWDDPDGVRIGVMYDTDLMPFERTACGRRGVHDRGRIADSVSRGQTDSTIRNGALPGYAAQVLERRVDAQGPPWIYNTWEPFERGINRDIALELIDAASAMGMDIFTIDDGWQQEYGENAVNLTSFPGGLETDSEGRGAKGHAARPVDADGRDRNQSTAEYRKHPEWASLDQEGKTKITGTMGGQKAVMCMASAFRDAAADRIIDAIERFRLAYVKLDLTTIFNAYGEAPGCWAKGHDHRNLGRIAEPDL